MLYSASILGGVPVNNVLNRQTIESKGVKKIRRIRMKGPAFLVFFGVIGFNMIVFKSPNLASSSPDTLFFSHQKYHYLFLPKLDIDVILKKVKVQEPKLLHKTLTK